MVAIDRRGVRIACRDPWSYRSSILELLCRFCRAESHPIGIDRLVSDDGVAAKVWRPRINHGKRDSALKLFGQLLFVKCEEDVS